MTHARRAALTALAAAVLGGAVVGWAAPVSAATEPTKLWKAYPLEPAAPHAARSTLPRLTPPTPATRSPHNRPLLAGELARLFLFGGAAALVLTISLSVWRGTDPRFRGY
jgi:hypothetical protein